MESLFSADAATPGLPYWWRQESESPSGLPFELPSTSSELPAKTELLVIGAGYTGLSAAIAASDAGAKVVVVDAGVPGEGASTRNGGMFGAHPRLGLDTLSKKFGAETATAIFYEAQDAFNFTSDLINREKIDCQFDQCGRIQLAWTKAHFAAQQNQVQQLRSVSNMKLELVEKDQLSKEINSPCYFGAIRFPEHASVQPRQLHDGLLRAALDRSITLIQRCPLEQVSKQHSHYVALARNGKQIQADKVVMATNGYTQGKFDWFARRVFPLPSYLIATEPLSNNLISSLAPGRRMMVETRARHSYFRISPDGSRIIFGGRASMTPIQPMLAANRLRQSLIQIWPELDRVKLTHCWSGFTGYSFTHMPQVGQHQGLHFSMGYSGSGVALAPYLGAKAAYQALGDARGETAYQQSFVESRWYHRARKPHFLKPANLWYQQVIDRKEETVARRDAGD